MNAKQLLRNLSESLYRLQVVILLRICSIIALLLIANLTGAQSYSIDWFKISGGGGTSTGSVYAVSGTIGQPDVGTMSGGNYSLSGGFWALYALQTPGAPTLHIIRSGTAVTVYWQNVSGWTLQQNGNLATSGWSANSSWTSNPNGTNYLQLPSPTGNLFFRLTK